MIHNRYDASKTNPFNEIECSDHYARAMASYGTFITACGFEYQGLEALLGLHPNGIKEISKRHLRLPKVGDLINKKNKTTYKSFG